MSKEAKINAVFTMALQVWQDALPAHNTQIQDVIDGMSAIQLSLFKTL
jgi:hypothetical protein